MTSRRSGSLSLLAAVELFLQLLLLNPGLRGVSPTLGGVSPFRGLVMGPRYLCAAESHQRRCPYSQQMLKPEHQLLRASRGAGQRGGLPEYASGR